MNSCPKQISTVVAALGALCLERSLMAADPIPATGPSVTQPATMAQVDAQWRDVLTQLESTTFSEREKAQKELDKLTYKQMDLLKQLAAGATDGEVKSRLLNRIAQIEEELAYSPPPISLDIQNGSMADVTTALGKAMELQLESWPPPGPGQPGGAAWNLSVKEKPFWEVIFELQKQRSFGFQDFSGKLRLTQQEVGLRAGSIFGGLAVFPQAITRLRTTNLQEDPGSQLQPEVMRLSFTAMLDPRVAVSKSMTPELTKVVDDLGNILCEPPEQANAQWNNLGWNSTHMWTLGAPLTIAPKLGKKITSAQGRLRLLVQLATDKLEVADMDKKLNTPFKIGGKTVTFQRFEPQPDNNTVRFQMQISGPPQNNAPGSELNPANALVTVSYIDSSGKYIWGQTIQGSSGGSFGGQFVPPLKVVLSAPTKLKEVTIPFELKDLPLP